MGQVFLSLSMILNSNCFYSIFPKKHNTHGHFKLFQGIVVSVVSLWVHPQNVFLLDSNKSSTVLAPASQDFNQSKCRAQPGNTRLWKRHGLYMPYAIGVLLTKGGFFLESAFHFFHLQISKKNISKSYPEL